MWNDMMEICTYYIFETDESIVRVVMFCFLFANSITASSSAIPDR